jgi:uncharacterized repeat protein (TIGR03803 family)
MNVSRSTLSTGAVIAMLAGCGGGAPLTPSPAGPSTALRMTRAEGTNPRHSYSELYSFKGHPNDGADPLAGLLNVRGTLYGTTSAGGAHCRSIHGCGTVFSITTRGVETMLYSFKRGPGYGGGPQAGLVNINRTLYGTTLYGGAMDEGTVFAITASGTETLLHSFTGVPDGELPYAGLIRVSHTLYGTTRAGGANCMYGCGTVFSITTYGKETVLYSFKGGSGDGESPWAGLIYVQGALYGTTGSGGANGRGTVFSTTTSGKETVFYSFKGGSGDGDDPQAALISVNGTLYGTTSYGGAYCGQAGCGTVFAITPSGKESVLHSFGGSGDGAFPQAALINVNGTLYGTTEEGGAYCGPTGCGTIFSITTSGKETVLHSFGAGTDGVDPLAGLINVKGTLYGATWAGGANCTSNGGCGTVFSLSY